MNDAKGGYSIRHKHRFKSSGSRLCIFWFTSRWGRGRVTSQFPHLNLNLCRLHSCSWLVSSRALSAPSYAAGAAGAAYAAYAAYAAAALPPAAVEKASERARERHESIYSERVQRASTRRLQSAGERARERAATASHGGRTAPRRSSRCVLRTSRCFGVSVCRCVRALYALLVCIVIA
jgi:hypothetical protein